jgi:hypothetical protein
LTLPATSGSGEVHLDALRDRRVAARDEGVKDETIRAAFDRAVKCAVAGDDSGTLNELTRIGEAQGWLAPKGGSQ